MTIEEFAKAAYSLGFHLGEINAPPLIIEDARNVIRHAENLQRDKDELLRVATNTLSVLKGIIEENEEKGQSHAPGLVEWKDDIAEVVSKVLMSAASEVKP